MTSWGNRYPVNFSLYSQDSLLSDLHFATLDTLPGNKFQYNSSAMELLEVLLERIYKKYYEHSNRVFKAHLNMFYTKPFPTEAEIKNAVQGYNGSDKPRQFFNLKGYFLGPTMNSTINDMLKYIKANLLNNDKSISMTHQLTYGKEMVLN